MANFLGRMLQRRKHGEPVIIVSGLPRSGTSMMMKMLEAGGVRIMTDAVRQADVDNPRGYFEYERVKNLETETDKSYIHEGRGKALKVISFLLKDLPDDCFYRVIFMRRHLDEVIASQNRMLDRRGEATIDEGETMAEAYRNHLAAVKILVRKRANFEMLEFRYDEAVANPREAARAVNAFVGGMLDEQAMTSVIDAELYRNRKT